MPVVKAAARPRFLWNLITWSTPCSRATSAVSSFEPSSITRISIASMPGICRGRSRSVAGSVAASFRHGIWMMSFVIFSCRGAAPNPGSGASGDPARPAPRPREARRARLSPVGALPRTPARALAGTPHAPRRALARRAVRACLLSGRCPASRLGRWRGPRTPRAVPSRGAPCAPVSCRGAAPHPGSGAGGDPHAPRRALARRAVRACLLSGRCPGTPARRAKALAACGESPAAFGRRCIPPWAALGVVHDGSNTPGILHRRASLGTVAALA